MIEVKNLYKQFGNTKVVQNVNFKVSAGETFMLIGTSGSGKTTTLKMINRLIEPTQGSIFINGKNILQEKATEIRRNMGYVIQNIGLFPHYTIAENIAIVPKLFKWKKEKIQLRTLELMEMLNLPRNMLKRYPRELSGGQRQRVGLARALAVNPSVMLLDEPFGALDPMTRQEIRTEFQTLESLQNKSMIMVTHDIFEAVEMGDKIALMSQGKIQQLGTPKELIFQPKNDFVKDFFDSQRFELSLKVSNLRDILPYLDKEKSRQESSTTLRFIDETSLLTVLEEASKIMTDSITMQILDKNESVIKTIQQNQVLPTFYKMIAQYQSN